MASFYADENWPGPLTTALRLLGHDVLTMLEDGKAGQGIDDGDVLLRATELNRTVLTMNRKHFHRLHKDFKGHSGIITIRDHPDRDMLALLIHNSIQAFVSLEAQLVRINRPQ